MKTWLRTYDARTFFAIIFSFVMSTFFCLYRLETLKNPALFNISNPVLLIVFAVIIIVYLVLTRKMSAPVSKKTRAQIPIIAYLIICLPWLIWIINGFDKSIAPKLAEKHFKEYGSMVSSTAIAYVVSEGREINLGTDMYDARPINGLLAQQGPGTFIITESNPPLKRGTSHTLKAHAKMEKADWGKKLSSLSTISTNPAPIHGRVKMPEVSEITKIKGTLQMPVIYPALSGTGKFSNVSTTASGREFSIVILPAEHRRSLEIYKNGRAHVINLALLCLPIPLLVGGFMSIWSPDKRSAKIHRK